MAYEIEKDWITEAGLRAVVIIVLRDGLDGTKWRSHRCGYVGVTKESPVFGKTYDDVYADVHGGLTFASGENPYKYPVESELHWFGFDCAHYGDATIDVDPIWQYMPENGAVVRTLDFCITECESLAWQLKGKEK